MKGASNVNHMLKDDATELSVLGVVLPIGLSPKELVEISWKGGDVLFSHLNILPNKMGTLAYN